MLLPHGALAQDARVVDAWPDKPVRVVIPYAAGGPTDVVARTIGQRLTASPQMDAAQDWILGKYAAWGVTARKERYGTWLGWNRGVTHLDLIAPRVRSLEAYALAYSPGMARPVEGEVIAYPEGVATPEQFDAWLPNVKGKYFLMNPPRLSCRSPGQWQEFGTTEEIERVNQEQTRLQREWAQTNVAMSGGRNVWQKLKDAGALGVFTFQFSNYPGIQKVFGSPLQTVEIRKTLGVGLIGPF